MTDTSTKKSTTIKTTPEQIRALRAGVSDLLAYVRSREATEQYANRAFLEVVQHHIDTLVGIDGDVSQTVTEMLLDGDESSSFSLRRVVAYGRPILTRRAQVERMLAKKDKLIAAVKKIDPASMREGVEGG